MRKMTVLFGVAVVACVVLGGRLSPVEAKAQGQLLYSFQKAVGNDHYPVAPLVRDAAGNLYGTTKFGLGGQTGNVFELSPQSGGGWTETVLHSFVVNSGDGTFPVAGLTLDPAGNLYGTTTTGGAYGAGIVFELSPQSGGGWSYAILYSFGGYSGDGGEPTDGLIFDAAGNLYGTGSGGGSAEGGTVFELSPQGGGAWVESTLYSFQSNGNNGSKDGFQPLGGVVFDGSGNLYGTTSGGGPDIGGCNGLGCGTAFELSPQSGGTWAEAIIHAFRDNGVDGTEPYSPLTLDSSNNLYGTTFQGGGGYGTIFELSPKVGGGWKETVIYTFSLGPNGALTTAGLTLDPAGNLYGTTMTGGAYNNCQGGPYGGCGTIYKLSPKAGGGWSQRVIFNFRDGHNNGHDPIAGVILDPAGNVYGTTPLGGTYGGGTVYEVTP